MQDITIIMPFLNELNEPAETIRSIYSTVSVQNHNSLKIIAIDDGSIPMLQCNLSEFKNITVIKNKKRIGVDACRQLGVEQALTSNILIIDAHMRFNDDDWFNKMLDYLNKDPNTVWCTTCSVLGYGNMELSQAVDKYHGASLLFTNSNIIKDRPATEILEPKWLDKQYNQQDREYEIPCVLGANYFFKKEWFDYLHGLKGLQMWGTSEPFLSLKSWLAGGGCKITKNIEIGHKFRDNAPYSTNIWQMVYNKLFLCKTILPEDISAKLISNFKKDENFNRAIMEINSNEKLINEEKTYNKSILKFSINDFCKKFGIENPQK